MDPSANDSQALRLACRNGHSEIVELLCADSRVDPSACRNDAIHSAIMRNYYSIFHRLLKDPRIKVEPTFLTTIATCGFPDALKTLLKDPRVDPFWLGPAAVRIAIQRRFLKMVPLLIQDPRIFFSLLDDPVIFLRGYMSRKLQHLEKYFPFFYEMEDQFLDPTSLKFLALQKFLAIR